MDLAVEEVVPNIDYDIVVMPTYVDPNVVVGSVVSAAWWVSMTSITATVVSVVVMLVVPITYTIAVAFEFVIFPMVTEILSSLIVVLIRRSSTD